MLIEKLENKPATGGIMRRALAAIGVAAGIAATSAMAAGCSTSSASPTGSGGGGAPVVLRLGFQTNITHAPALIGVAKGFFT